MRRQSWILAFALISAVALGAPTAARADGPRFEMTPFAGYRVGGQFEVDATETTPSRSIDVSEDASFGLDLGLYRDSSSFYEFLYSQQKTGLDSNEPLLDDLDVKIEYFQFGGTLLFPEQNPWLVPYLSLTAGITRLSADGNYDTDTKFSMSLGGGLRLPFSDRVAANLGLRGYLTFVSSDTDLFCVSDSSQAGCLLKSSGSTFFQGEATVGLTVRF